MSLRLLFPPSLGGPKALARAELVERSLRHDLGEPVSVEIAATYADLERRAGTGDVHVAWAPAGVCARVEPSAHAIFKVVRGGLSTYRSALVARKDRGLSLARLRGLRAAWVDPLSIGGHVLITDHLRSVGLEPSRLFASQRFVGSHPEVLGAVLHGAADVGAVSVPGREEDGIRRALAMHAGPASAQLAVLAVSSEAPADALVLTCGLTREQATRLAERLLRRSSPGASSLLLSAMDAEGLARAKPGEYGALLRMMRG